jgi:hypothetical protein
MVVVDCERGGDPVSDGAPVRRRSWRRSSAARPRRDRAVGRPRWPDSPALDAASSPVIRSVVSPGGPARVPRGRAAMPDPHRGITRNWRRNGSGRLRHRLKSIRDPSSRLRQS